MKERVEKIRESIKSSKYVYTVADDLVLIGLRQIELLEELIELTRGKEYGKWIESERPKRIFIGRRKPGPKPRQPKPGFNCTPKLVGNTADGDEGGKDLGTVQTG